MYTHAHGQSIDNIELNKNIRNLKHNGIISFWKFMFAMMVVIYHANTLAINGENVILRYGRIGVEFFFLVSGYLMAKKALNKQENCSNIGKETFHYIWKKIKSFFPLIFVAFLFEFAFKLFVYKYSTSQMVNSIWNLLFIRMSGIKTTVILVQVWYISVMLISMLILYPLIRKYKNNFIYLIAPIIVIFISGWLSHTQGNLDGYNRWTGFVYLGLLRAFFELTLGTIIYELVERMKRFEFTKLGRYILTLIEIGGFISIFFIANNVKKPYNKYDFVMLLILSISILCAFSEKTLFFNFSNNKLFYYLEKLSLPIYLNHMWIILIIKNFLRDLNYWTKLGMVVFFTIVFSIIIMFIIEKIQGKPTEIVRKFFIVK